MIGNIDLNNKTYDEILAQAISQIPIYSKDWTNYNVSDPGITILENLSAFSALLQSEINEVPEKIRYKLLELAGFVPKKGRPVRAYVETVSGCNEESLNLINGIKLYAQDICFEFEENKVLRNSKIYSIKSTAGSNGDWDRLLLGEGLKGGAYIFGKKPAVGDYVCLYLDKPIEGDDDLSVYFEVERQFDRNEFEEGMENPFAKLKWEVLTPTGYERIEVEDGTNCFMESGYVRLFVNNLTSINMIRVTLEKADYDIVPKFVRIAGLLHEITQRDTKSYVQILDMDNAVSNGGGVELMLENYILGNGYPEIYGLEEDGFYHRYYATSQRGAMRYFQLEMLDNNKEKALFMYNKPKKVMAVFRDESVIAFRKLGMLYGYDEQTLELPPIEKCYGGRFSILVVKKNLSGEEICHVVYPEDKGRGEVYYSVNENDNTIVIHDCGDYEGAAVRLGTYCVYLGGAAEVLPNTEFAVPNSELNFANVAYGKKGYYSEDFEKLRRRFATDIKKPVTMVTENDCRNIVKSIPALSIHKVGVSTDSDKNEISVVVKPNSLERFPKLSRTYMAIMNNYFEKYRMLTTKVTIKQPVYVAINVSGIMYTKKYLKNSRKNIEATIRKMLDGINSEAGFGGKVVFHEIYEKIINMDCVDSITELVVAPENYKYVTVSGLDIHLDTDALFYPGEINLEVLEI